MLPPASARARLGAVLAAWALVVLSQPGLGRSGGFGHTAFVALVPWALVCARPGRAAKSIEWLGATLGLVGMTLWMRHLLPWLVPLLGLVPGVYVVLSGVLLRRMARRYTLALAVPAAWTVGEALRWGLNAPLSFGWWRLGTMAHDTPWLAGSARVWGVWGLTWVFAAFAGWLADLWRHSHPLAGFTPAPRWQAHVFGLGPLTLAVALSALVRPPATVPGPRVLLVTPGLEQRFKAGGSRDPLFDLFLDPCALTAQGLAAAAAAGEPVDLVAWGETMLYGHALADGVEAAFRAGAQAPAWTRRTWDEDWLLGGARALETEVNGVLFGDVARRSALFDERLRALDEPWAEAVAAGGALLPPGTSFFSGTEIVVVRGGDELRRLNGAYVWDARGKRGPPAAKVHLVPGAEDPRGMQGFTFILDAMEAVGGYVPDFVAGDEVAILELRARAGDRVWRVGATVCYDNVFDDPYTDPTLRPGSVDFHLVASNEAWYVDSPEMDHMLAFSRLAAIASGRSLVRATNSGVTIVFDPAGREVAALEQDGRRKMARGTLRAVVPVPRRDGRGAAPVTPYARTRRLQQVLGWLLLAVLTLVASRRVTPGDERVRTAAAEGAEPAGSP
jgi:apolipoprotein N-acyltransferase